MVEGSMRNGVEGRKCCTLLTPFRSTRFSNVTVLCGGIYRRRAPVPPCSAPDYFQCDGVCFLHKLRKCKKQTSFVIIFSVNWRSYSKVFSLCLCCRLTSLVICETAFILFFVIISNCGRSEDAYYVLSVPLTTKASTCW